MLIEFLESFLGAYYYFVPDTYANRDYFTSIICVIVFSVLLAGVMGAVLLTIHHTFIASRGSFRK